MKPDLRLFESQFEKLFQSSPRAKFKVCPTFVSFAVVLCWLSDGIAQNTNETGPLPAPYGDRWGEPNSGLDRYSPKQMLCGPVGPLSCGYKRVSDVVLFTSIGIGLGTGTTYTFSDGNEARLSWKPALGYLMGPLANVAVTQLAKLLAARPRPYTYSRTWQNYNRERAPNPGVDQWKDADDKRSFFSGHSSITSSNLFFAATSYALFDIAPKRAATAAFFGIATGMSCWVALLRVWAGKHFFSDVVTGFLVGALLGVAGPLIASKMDAAWLEDADDNTAFETNLRRLPAVPSLSWRF